MQEDLITSIREFAEDVVDPFDVDELLGRLMARTILTLRADGAGIMLANRDGGLEFAVASHNPVESVEALQDQLHTGACYEAFTTGQMVIVTDLILDDRWPAYRGHALAAGLRSVIGIPLRAAARIVGVLDIYRSTQGEWSSDDLDACETLAALGAAYLLANQQAVSQHQLTGQLYAALGSRGTIERAKGIIMARGSLDADTAFKRLCEASMATNRKLRDVAQQVIDHYG